MRDGVLPCLGPRPSSRRGRRIPARIASPVAFLLFAVLDPPFHRARRAGTYRQVIILYFRLSKYFVLLRYGSGYIIPLIHFDPTLRNNRTKSFLTRGKGASCRYGPEMPLGEGASFPYAVPPVTHPGSAAHWPTAGVATGRGTFPRLASLRNILNVLSLRRAGHEKRSLPEERLLLVHGWPSGEGVRCLTAA